MGQLRMNGVESLPFAGKNGALDMNYSREKILRKREGQGLESIGRRKHWAREQKKERDTIIGTSTQNIIHLLSNKNPHLPFFSPLHQFILSF